MKSFGSLLLGEGIVLYLLLTVQRIIEFFWPVVKKGIIPHLTGFDSLVYFSLAVLECLLIFAMAVFAGFWIRSRYKKKKLFKN